VAGIEDDEGGQRDKLGRSRPLERFPLLVKPRRNPTGDPGLTGGLHVQRAHHRARVSIHDWGDGERDAFTDPDR
jgi:hypothetical protein